MSDELRTAEKWTRPGRFWPFGTRLAIMMTPLLLVVLLVVWGLSRELLHFEGASAGWVLLGIVLLSLVPVLLVILDGLAQSGGSVEVGQVKLALTAAATAQNLVVLPRNVTQQENIAGSATRSITDSSSMQILETLRRARASRVVAIDLEDGTAWWESRLLIVSAGAVRLGRPEVVVFTATREGQQDRFVGWGHPADLLSRLLQANPDYT
ncbi:MAG: hypothetical protein ACRDPR_16630, partial [Nocardioidaceae bacterium]